jgi:signal transduction histidine kinase
LHRLMQDTMKNNEDVVYLFIQDTQGNVIVDSFGVDGVPSVLHDLNTVAGEERYKISNFHSEEGFIHDIAVPIFEGRAGTVRLGLGEDSLRRIASDMMGSLIFYMLILFTLGLLAAYFLSGLLLVPVNQLIQGTRAVASGDLSVRAVPWAKDELGQLTEAFNFMTKKLDDYRKESLAKEKMRVQLVKKLIAAQEDERKRIARELHDETAQSLTSIKLSLKVIEDARELEAATRVARELRGMLNRTMEEVSSLARDLRPSVLDDMGLQASLADYIDKCSSVLNKAIDFHLQGLHKCRFPSYVETTVYRVVQEALTNVIKHAQAENISVVVRYSNEVLTAIVEDDGIGFDPASVSQNGGRGLGLFGMHERAALVGGTLEIESEAGEGTTVYLNIPVTGGPENDEN